MPLVGLKWLLVSSPPQENFQWDSRGCLLLWTYFTKLTGLSQLCESCHMQVSCCQIKHARRNASPASWRAAKWFFLPQLSGVASASCLYVCLGIFICCCIWDLIPFQSRLLHSREVLQGLRVQKAQRYNWVSIFLPINTKMWCNYVTFVRVQHASMTHLWVQGWVQRLLIFNYSDRSLLSE